MTRRALILAAVLAIAATGGGTAAFLAVQTTQPQRIASDRQAVWTEIAWPFPLDPWGRGRAFRCNSADCGDAVALYLRAKLGFCGCVTAIDDEEVDRVGDADLLGGERVALGRGRAIEVRWMKGRSRGYTISGRGATAKSALLIAFHDRCDMIVATAAIASNKPHGHEEAVIAFLNSDLVLRWAEVTLGL